MEKFEVRVESVTRFFVEAETKEQAEAIVEKTYRVTFDDENIKCWDSYDEYETTVIEASNQT